MTTRALQIIGLHAGYGDKTVLRGVNLNIESGEWFCLLGPNGVGKSTLLHCISTEVEPSEGDVIVAGRSVLADPQESKRLLGFGSKPEQLPGLLTGRECLQIFANAKDISSIESDLLDLSEALGFATFMDQCVDTYSLGTRQKLCVLLAFVGQPRLIVLDEAFNGLDPTSSLVLKRYLKHRIASTNCSVLLATHSLDIVEHYADRAALLLDGQIARLWNGADLEELRTRGGNALEESVSAISLNG
jgi:ABC-2 type transport system ATP-binding protein